MMDHDEAEYLKRWEEQSAWDYDQLVWGLGIDENIKHKPKVKKVKKKSVIKTATKKKKKKK